jgi:hypothetical protein
MPRINVPFNLTVQGTNVGVQLRKLYDPWQFPDAPIHKLFNETFGLDHTRICALGVEANPVHTPWLTQLNAYFRHKGYQAIVLTETAASINSGHATFHLDHGSPVEWGASLSFGTWQGHSNETTNEATVTLLDLPGFLADIVRTIITQEVREFGRKPPTAMKLDVEGEEYALLPSMITNGALCDLSMIYMEVHPPKFKSDAGKAVNMDIPEMERVFDAMRKANPRCNLTYSHLDDETYMHADREVPLPL